MSRLKLGCIVCNVRNKRPSYGTSAATICARFKSDGTKSTEIVVEKEKQNKSLKLGEWNWSEVPKKMAKARAYVSEVVKHPIEQRIKGRTFRDDEILYYFRNENDLDNWIVATDQTLGGKSWAGFVQGENGLTATFRGFISQRLPRYMLPSTYDKLEDKPYYRGFANLETKPFINSFNQEDRLSLVGFNAIDVRLRGDGRKYFFEMSVDDGISNFMHSIPVHTRGGPEWETVRLPFGKFTKTKRNTLVFHQSSFNVNWISCLRFLLLDGIEGPFQLEIDYIALVKDLTESTTGTDYWDPNSSLNSSIGTW